MQIIIASLLLLLVSSCGVLGNNVQVEGDYSVPNEITRISIKDSILEYTWIKHNSCVNSHLVLDHGLKKGNFNRRVLKIDVKLINKQSPVMGCLMMRYEKDERINLFKKLREIANQYGFELENSHNDCVNLIDQTQKCISVELHLPVIKLSIK